MLLALSPCVESLKETINTLNFGSRVRGIELGSAQVSLKAPNVTTCISPKYCFACCCQGICGCNRRNPQSSQRCSYRFALEDWLSENPSWSGEGVSSLESIISLSGQEYKKKRQHQTAQKSKHPRISKQRIPANLRAVFTSIHGTRG